MSGERPDELTRQQFSQWNAERDQFELSWRSNESLLLAPMPVDLDALKEFAWHVWQHAVSSAKRRQMEDVTNPVCDPDAIPPLMGEGYDDMPNNRGADNDD